ncbi:Blue-light-activated protein [Lacunisphaera limnophila]|uniref:histidine kinase n=1 Tax=Lacunisphaera limnophila TaxID=1838286 RepID=A0A1D8AT80_9BACT|nr:ATP-binding protein [Lacunisphaera limnophila]AOS44093.1 Blue-light-activated protein [Lacunisphaera limnophila]
MRLILPAPCLRLLPLLLLAGGLGLTVPLRAEELPRITDPAWIWAMPTEQKARPHPLRLEGRVQYFDPSFKMMWLESNGVSTYVQLSARTPPLRTGQQVVIEGTIVPHDGLDRDRIQVTVREEHRPVTPLDLSGPINDIVNLGGRIVRLQGYVNSQQLIDDQHVLLNLLYENRLVTCWFPPDNPQRLPDLQGKMVRVTGLYSGRFDPTNTRMTIEIWAAAEAGIEVLGALPDDPRFNQTLTPIGEINRHASGTELRVRGRLEAQRQGERLVLRDSTGQVEILSQQFDRLEPGDLVDAVGRVAQTEGWILTGALYRRVVEPAVAGPSLADRSALTRIAEILAHGRAELAAGLAVDLTGMVTWSLPDPNFDILFLQDTTGGIRVRYDKAKTGVIHYGKYFNIKGVTRAGPTAPEVELQTYVDLGSMSHPRPRIITLETAQTGAADGEWVELRGFLRRTDSEGDWRWIRVTTPTGEFTGHLQSPVNFVANPGSLIRVRGVCDVIPGAPGQPSSVTLRVPFLHDITIERDAPANYYDLPRRALEDLEKIGTAGDMQRVRVTGTVVHAVPGRQLYLQEGSTGLLVLSADNQEVQPGDRIEAVGILGREGGHTVLREAVFRRTASGAAPVPEDLADVGILDPNKDFRLGRVRGTLLAVFHEPTRSRLTLQQGPMIFDVRLERPEGTPPPPLELTAELAVTGIYKVTFDDARMARGFELLARSPADIVVTRPARLWTVRRALAVAGLLGGCVLLGTAWITMLRRRVRAQTEVIRQHLEQRARHEAGVQNAARLESLGVLAGGIAHDFNNLLTVFMGNVSLMKLSPSVMATEAPRVAEIERGLLRARDLARQLLTFASGGEPLCVPVDMAALVRTAAASALRGSLVGAEQAGAVDLWPGHGDHDQLMQVVQNLVQNAREAMPGGGTVRLALANETIPSGASGGLAPGRYVRLTVSDQGPGIPAAVLPKIFDPYFTTRPGARGLGLATVYSVITRHGGRVEAASPPGSGAVLTLWLPAVPARSDPSVEAAPAPGPGAPAAATETTKPRVLFMDDEESLRVLASAVLRRMGLDPVAVPDGQSALREFKEARNAGRPFALLIMDLTIPGGMGGKETIAAVRQLDPAVPAIVSSGYSSDPVMANYQGHGFQAVVPKPFDVAALSAAVCRFIPQAKPM